MSRATEMTWARTTRDIADTFRKWGVDQYEVLAKNWGQPATKHFYMEAERAERSVSVRFVHPDGRTITLAKDDWDRPVDNFRQLYHGIEAMRVIWTKGLEAVVRTAYMQLEGPAMQRDPYEVLGIRSDAPLEIAEAAYKAAAKRAHPDAGGSTEAMKELNEAIERVRSDKAVPA